VCNDGVREGDEECDGADLGGKSCKDFEPQKFVAGQLSCTRSCEFNASACVECTTEDTSLCIDDEICSESGYCVDPSHTPVCGDGRVEGDEECDKSNLNAKTCADFEGYSAGDLLCSEDCHYNLVNCLECEDDAHCADRSDGKSQCVNTVCDFPTMGECDAENHCPAEQYCQVNTDDPSQNVCTERGDCKANGCTKIGTTDGLCSDVAWDKPGVFTKCDFACENGQCKTSLCVAPSCNPINATEYCDTTSKPEGEWKQCDTPKICVSGSCVINETPLVVISQAYTGGANSGSSFQSKYVELFNRGNEDARLESWSLQYASGAGTRIYVCPLPENMVIPAKSYYLVDIRQSTNGDAPIAPDADHKCSPNLLANIESGKLFLVNSPTPLSSVMPDEGTFVDALGYGGANWAEGGENATAPKLSKTSAAYRRSEGCIDTNNNKDDFVVGLPSPRNSATEAVNCSDIKENTTARCKDGIDNDGNGKIDCDDSDCSPFC